MQVFGHAVTQMLVLVLLMAAGIVLRRRRYLNDGFDARLTHIVMDLALPAMIVSSVLSSESLPETGTILQLVGLSFLSYTLVAVVASLVSRLFHGASPSEQGAHAFVITFGNVGFMGLPVLNAIFGPQAVFYGAVYNIPFNIFVFTIGIWMIGRGKEGPAGKHDPIGTRARNLLRSVLNPTLVSCFVAIALALLHITDHEGVIGLTCRYLGNLTVPASMLVIGSTLGKMSVRSMLDRVSPYASSFLRLVAVPVLVFLAFRPFVTDPLVLGVITVTAGMPCASLGTMLSITYGGDTATITRATFISTACSVLTIPLLVLLLT
ncbi:MAG: AEC family transporter [Coriobacteriales bacterium]|nr:AEC family transporter [Coriobacteriales bacterium]